MRAQSMMRVFDIVLSVAAMLVLLPLMIFLTLVVSWDVGSPIFSQQRVGRNCKPFTIFKFRTMGVNTPSVATHHVDASAITPFGRFLRRTKLDEMPQLWNVIVGEMSLVGPRPCLFSQKELISERAVLGVFEVRPGITGLAQIQHIDMSTPQLLAQTDKQMLDTLNLKNYFLYIVLTITGRGRGDRVKFR